MSEWDQFGKVEEEEWEKFEEAPLDHDFNAMNAIKNIPGSALQLGKDIVGAVTSPIETAKGIGALGQSALAKGQRKVQELAAGVDIEAGDDEAIADAVWEAATERYGGIEELQRTIENDPVGFLSDFGGALGATGKLAKVGKLGKVGDALETAGNAVDPLTMVTNRITKRNPQAIAEGLYQSAAKFPTTMNNRQAITQATLRQRLEPTRAGTEKLDARMKGRIGEIETLLDRATEANKSIPVEKLWQYMDDLFDKKGGLKAEAGRDQAKIMKVFEEAVDNMNGRTHMTPSEAQAFKIDLYDKVYMRRQSGEATKRRGTKTEAMSEMARASKDAINEAVPGVAPLNADLADLYKIKPALNRATNRLENTNKIPMRALISGTGGGAAALLGGGPLAAAVMVALPWIADSPKLKTNLAFGINLIRKGDLEAAEKVLQGSQSIRVAMALAGRTEEELEQLGLNYTEEPLQINIQDGRTP